MKPDSVWRLHVENAEEEIAAADFPEIRYINVFRNESYDTVEDISSNGWHVCSPESVIWLSAAGYYFARTLQEALDVPVGLLVDVYGGTGRLYIPQPDTLLIPVRDKKICEQFDGGNIYELARKWSLSDAYIRQIVKDKAAEIRRTPTPGQLSLEECVKNLQK